MQYEIDPFSPTGLRQKIEFPKNNQVILQPSGFNPKRYYDKSQIDALFAAFSPAGNTLWGDIEGTLSDQTDLQNALDGTHTIDADVTVTEFFGSAVNLGTGGSCRIDTIEQGSLIYVRIAIKFGTSPSLGTLPLVIKASDFPITLPEYAEQTAMPGSFGALSKTTNVNQMYAPAMNNIGGFGNCILFFSQYGASFTEYLMGSSATIPPEAGDNYFGAMIIPVMDMDP